MLLEAVLNGKLAPSRGLRDRLSSCLLCGACVGACPSGVDLPEIVAEALAVLPATPGRKAAAAVARRLAGGGGILSNPAGRPAPGRRALDIATYLYGHSHSARPAFPESSPKHLEDIIPEITTAEGA